MDQDLTREPSEPSEPTLPQGDGESQHISRRDLMREGTLVAARAVVCGAGVGELLTGCRHLRELASALSAQLGVLAGRPASALKTKAGAIPIVSRFPASYFHGCFTVNTPEEADAAAQLGINYTISYGVMSPQAADLDTPLGKALARNDIKTFLNVENPFLSCSSGQGQLNVEGVRALVSRFKNSPLLAGYWTKDDDCGTERDLVRYLYSFIRSIDPDPTHLIMAGFADAASVSNNYLAGQADLLGFYPYPAYSRGPARELPEMLSIVHAHTPPGDKPPPFIGIYQAFGNPPGRPVPSPASILDQAQIYMAHGAVGLMGFGWEADGESYVPGNDADLRTGILDVSSWLLGHLPARA